MPQGIREMLFQNGAMLSSDIAERLDAEGVTPEAIRKRISRAGPPVSRLKGVNFPNKEAFLFIDGDFGTPDFKSHLEEALIKTGTSYGRALLGIAARHGAVCERDLPAATGLPVRPTKRQILCSAAIEKLKQLGLLIPEAGTEQVVFATYGSPGMTPRLRAIRVAEDIMLMATRSWLVRAGFSSTNVVSVRIDGRTPLTGPYGWDLCCPTYLSGIATRTSSTVRPGSLVCDVILGRHLAINDLKPFIAKCDSLIHQRRESRLQPMIIADSFERAALDMLRTRGTFIARPEAILGADTARDLRQLIDTIANAAMSVTSSPDKVFELVGRMSRLEGAALNLRAVVLELIMAHLYKEDGLFIEIRKKIRDSKGQTAEIDIMASSHSNIYFCECKGMAPGSLVNRDTIDTWESKKLPRIKEWFKTSPYRDHRAEFRFYASTGYADEALMLIADLALKHRKQPISFLNGVDILGTLEKRRESALIDVFNEQFVVR